MRGVRAAGQSARWAPAPCAHGRPRGTAQGHVGARAASRTCPRRASSTLVLGRRMPFPPRRVLHPLRSLVTASHPPGFGPSVATSLKPLRTRSSAFLRLRRPPTPTPRSPVVHLRALLVAANCEQSRSSLRPGHGTVANSGWRSCGRKGGRQEGGQAGRRAGGRELSETPSGGQARPSPGCPSLLSVPQHCWTARGVAHP